MNAKIAVREVMKRKGVGTNALAARIGKIPRVVSDRLSMDRGRSISVETLDEMVRAMDYKVMLVPREMRVQDGMYEIE